MNTGATELGTGRRAHGLPVVVESRHFFVEKDPPCWYAGGLYDSTGEYQASFQGIHWWPVEFLKYHRAEVERVNLRLGYRFVLKEASWPRTVKVGEHPETVTEKVRFGWDWPFCGNYYQTGLADVHHDGTVTRHGPKVPTVAPGEYDLCLSLGRPDGTPRIALPLKDQLGQTRRYRLGRIVLA